MNRRFLSVVVAVLVAGVALPRIVFAHPGGLDKDGCHTNRKTGEYHCHQGEQGSSTSRSSRSESIDTRHHATQASTRLPQDSDSLAQQFVMRVIDGDTIELSNGERVRLIGVDTPETVHPNKPVEYFGKEASAFTKALCEGKTVRLDYDWQRQDKYGRTLAYLYLADGRMVNAEIIKQGYGFAYTKYPFNYMEEFRTYERGAREAQRGLWNVQEGDP